MLVGDLKTLRVMEWMYAFQRNCYTDFDPKESDFAIMIKYYNAGLCPTESAAAICEGRELDVNSSECKRKRETLTP